MHPNILFITDGKRYAYQNTVLQEEHITLLARCSFERMTIWQFGPGQNLNCG